MNARNLFLLVGIGVAVNAAAQDWQPVPTSDRLVLVDAASIQRQGRSATMQVLESYARRQTIGDDAYPHRSRVVTYQFICAQHRYAVMDWQMFSEPLARGTVVWNGTTQYPSYLEAKAGEPEAVLLARACSDQTAWAGAAQRTLN
jgi:hypothetical protein